MAADLLTVRQLNRATLARQLLLERSDMSLHAAVERLVGLQGQASRGPFVGLWTRLAGFERAQLAAAVDDRSIIKATMVRATLHVVTTADYLAVRPTLQPVLSDAFAAIRDQRPGPFDLDAVVAEARRHLDEAPRSFAELTTVLTAAFPDADPGTLRYGVRTHVPLVQVPTATTWSFPGNPRFTPAASWLARSLPDVVDRAALVRRYLAAFGPATAADLRTWSGLDLADTVAGLADELRVHPGGRGKDLYDLPDGPRPDPDVVAPVRFLPEFDNVLLAHAKRTRIVADEHRKRVYLPGLQVSPTFLVDGMVAGVWGTAVVRKAATLTIEPFAALDRATRQALEEEGEALVRFIEPGARTWAVRLEEPA